MPQGSHTVIVGQWQAHKATNSHCESMAGTRGYQQPQWVNGRHTRRATATVGPWQALVVIRQAFGRPTVGSLAGSLDGGTSDVQV